MLAALTALSLAAVSPATAGAAAAPTTPQEAADQGAAEAAEAGVTQSVVVVDRTTGQVLASHAGGRVYNSQSIVKLFTAAFYLAQVNGRPDAKTAATLSKMVRFSDDSIQRSLWKASIITSVGAKYGLTNTRNANNASARNWGSGKINANDEAHFLYAVSRDPMIGASIMGWMAAAEPKGSDGFNQSFGLNALTGDHGSKQGWSDPGSAQYNLHSIGWTGNYFVAILQVSSSAGTEKMRTTATATARLLADLAQPSQPQCAQHNSSVWGQVVGQIFASIEPVRPVVWCAAG